MQSQPLRHRRSRRRRRRSSAPAIGAGVSGDRRPRTGRRRPSSNSVTTVDHSQQIAATSGLTVTEIYQRANRGVVDIKVKRRLGLLLRARRRADRHRRGLRVRLRHAGPHRHEPARRLRRDLDHGQVLERREVPAHVVGTDRSTDLAVIKVDAPSRVLHPLDARQLGPVQVGAGVVAIGSPFGLAESVTSGIVSALHRQMNSSNGFTIDDSIQTDAPINHGNSGGPLLNAAGQVIGVNAQIQSESGGSDGVGFAIPSNTVRSVVSQLIAGQP